MTEETPQKPDVCPSCGTNWDYATKCCSSESSLTAQLAEEKQSNEQLRKELNKVAARDPLGLRDAKIIEQLRGTVEEQKAAMERREVEINKAWAEVDKLRSTIKRLCLDQQTQIDSRDAIINESDEKIGVYLATISRLESEVKEAYAKAIENDKKIRDSWYKAEQRKAELKTQVEQLQAQIKELKKDGVLLCQDRENDALKKERGEAIRKMEAYQDILDKSMYYLENLKVHDEENTPGLLNAPEFKELCDILKEASLLLAERKP